MDQQVPGSDSRTTPVRHSSMAERAAEAAWLEECRMRGIVMPWQQVPPGTRAQFLAYAIAMLRTVRDPLRELHNAFSAALARPVPEPSPPPKPARRRPATRKPAKPRSQATDVASVVDSTPCQTSRAGRSRMAH